MFSQVWLPTVRSHRVTAQNGREGKGRTHLSSILLSAGSYRYLHSQSENNGGNLAGESICRNMHVSVIICWITSAGTSELYIHCPHPACSPFSPAPSVDRDWDGKLWVTHLCMSFLKSSCSAAHFPLTRHTGHIFKYHTCCMCTRAEFFPLLIPRQPPTWIIYTHTHTPLAPLWDGPSLSVVKMCLSHGQLAKANKPATCQLTRAWTGSVEGGWGGGLSGRCQEWQKEGHGHAKKTSTARASQPSHAGAQTCVLSCSPIKPN